MFPFAGMPVWAQMDRRFPPLTHYLRIVRAIMLGGATLPDLQNDALARQLMLFAMTIAVTLPTDAGLVKAELAEWL
jgi:ABC-2 type transport system permease protein